jgi:hypothetical protein
MENLIRLFFAPFALALLFAIFWVGLILAGFMIAVGTIGFIKLQLQNKRMRTI